MAESRLRAAQAQGRLYGVLPTLALPGSSAHNGSIREIKGSLPGEQADFGKLQVPPSSVVRGRRAHPPQSARTIALVRQARSAVHLVPSTI
jgi:hypothetical protein